MKLYEILHYSKKGSEEDLDWLKQHNIPSVMLYLFFKNKPEFIICDEQLYTDLIARGLQLRLIKFDELDGMDFKPINNNYTGNLHELLLEL